MKTAIITGASSGIGKALYEGLKSDPYWTNVYGVSRRGPDIKVDLTKFKGDVIGRINVDLLINCAGIMKLDEFGYEKEIMDINFWAAINLMTFFKRYYNKNACVINIASISALKPDKDMPIYAASKAALIAASKTYAKKWAPFVRVNCISPGYYKSNLVPGDTPKHLIEAIPVKYEEDPKTLVSLINAIYNSKFMTGSNIVIDGGETL